MFASSPHSLPSPFNPDRRPLQLTPERIHSSPTGECHFVLIHPAVPNQRCSCQFYQHNNRVSGHVCDCGHQACFHQTAPADNHRYEITNSATSLDILAEKVKRLEENLQAEREIRFAELQKERQTWEREIRILREALAPFYNNDQDVQRRLLKIEDQIEGNYDEQIRLKERVVTIDDANMAIERRVERLEGVHVKRRRIDNSDHENGQHHYPQQYVPCGSYTMQLHHNHSHKRKSKPHRELDEPRSSGLLNLVDLRHPPRPSPTNSIMSRERQALIDDEPRSSGFLALDLAERLRGRVVDPPAYSAANLRPPSYRQSIEDNPPPAVVQPPDKASNDELRSRVDSSLERQPESSSMAIAPSKGKAERERAALDMLANVTVASPLTP